MKLKIVILGICALLSACGARKNIPTDSKVFFLKNLQTQNFLKIQSSNSGKEFHILGVFEKSTLPDSLHSLNYESEIGSLSVEFEEAIYRNKYEGEVQPSYKKRLQEIKTTVYLLKDENFPAQVSFAIRDDENSKLLNPQEEAVTIQSAPRQFCYQISIQDTKLNDIISIPSQNPFCQPSGDCPIKIHRGWVFNDEVPGVLHLNDPNVAKHSCLNYQTHYSKTETKFNRSTPKRARINSIIPMDFEL